MLSDYLNEESAWRSRLDVRADEKAGRQMTSSKREAVREIVLEFASREDSVEDSTRLVQDLRIGGDDAWELLEKIHARFGTSFKDIDFDAFFPDEGEMFGYGIATFFGWKDRRKKITFGHLVKIVDGGKWFEPDTSCD
jgi:Protein of unknown function (DUF1493)